MERIATQKKNAQTFANQPSKKTISAILAYGAAASVIKSRTNVYCVTNN